MSNELKLTRISTQDMDLMDATKPQPACIILARGGSKRIKHKNKRLLHGRPLFDYALKAAIDSKIFSLIIVSSDDTQILEHTYSYFHLGMVQPQKRPQPLCGDDVPIKAALRYSIQSYRCPDTICLIQPTNPLITSAVIKDSYDKYRHSGKEYLFGMDGKQDLGFHFFEQNTFMRDYEKLWDVDYFDYQMKGVDIDTEEDWMRAEKLCKS